MAGELRLLRFLPGARANDADRTARQHAAGCNARWEIGEYVGKAEMRTAPSRLDWAPAVVTKQAALDLRPKVAILQYSRIYLTSQPSNAQNTTLGCPRFLATELPGSVIKVLGSPQYPN